MWIFTKTEKGASLINLDHVARFYVNKSAVYAIIGDCDIERVIGLESEEAAADFLHWLAEHVGPYKCSSDFNGAKVVILSDERARG